jgi:hypothetical protein
MLNAITDIKDLWSGDALNIDDTVKDENDKTAFDRYLEKEGKKIKRRLIAWVGQEAYNDALLGTPLDQSRKDSLQEAEEDLFHVTLIEKLWRDKSAGAEREVTFPSGMRIALQAFNTDEYEKIINAHTQSADQVLQDYKL